MENNLIFQKAEQLRKCLNQDEHVLLAQKSEQVMLKDDEVMKLISNFLTAQSALNDAIRFKLDLAKYQQDLSEKKTLLYTHPLVKDYLDRLKEANSYLEEIQKIVFDDLVVDFKEINCIKK